MNDRKSKDDMLFKISEYIREIIGCYSPREFKEATNCETIKEAHDLARRGNLHLLWTDNDDISYINMIPHYRRLKKHYTYDDADDLLYGLECLECNLKSEFKNPIYYDYDSFYRSWFYND